MMTKKIGLWAGLLVFISMLLIGAPQGMEQQAWQVAALTILMAIWWMTEALPLTVTALLPFLALPIFGVMTAKETAGQFYSPILFLILGGAFIALAIERVGLHRRVALGILSFTGSGKTGILIAFMVATAILSMLISNTSTTLIMLPIALAVLTAGGIAEEETTGFAGALIMGIAFAASIGGIGTLVGSPTNAIAAGLIEQQLGIEIDFLSWAKFGLPVVIIGIPVAALILFYIQRLSNAQFDGGKAREAIGDAGSWSVAEKRLMPIIAIIIIGWLFKSQYAAFFPKGAITDGTIAIAGAFLLFLIPDGDKDKNGNGRSILIWKEANVAPWGVIMMFGGGLALAAGITQSGLAAWLGDALRPLTTIHPLILAAAIVALVILITEFASNVATASGIIPVVAGLISATGVDPWLLAMPAAMAASWGFMLPSGTGPNALAWSTGHIALPKMLQAGFMLDIAGIIIITGMVWIIA